MEVKIKILFFFLISNTLCQSQIIDSLLNKFGEKFNFELDTAEEKILKGIADPFIKWGITGKWNDSIRTCYLYKTQPDLSNLKELIEALYGLKDTTIFKKVDEASIRFLKYYQLQWPYHNRNACRCIDLPELLQTESNLQKLNEARVYFNQLKAHNFNDEETFKFFYKMLKYCDYGYIIYLKNRKNEQYESRQIACNNDFVKLQSKEFLERVGEEWALKNSGTAWSIIPSIIEYKFKDWTPYLKKEMENEMYYPDTTYDKLYDYKSAIIRIVTKNKYIGFNDIFLNPRCTYLKSNMFDMCRYFGQVDEPRFMEILNEKHNTAPIFFKEWGEYDAYIAYPYGQYYSCIFFKKKLKEKLPKDKYLLAISAIARVADQEAVDLLKKEYSKKKDPRIKREILSAIYQAYYRQKLANRPSNDWFDNQWNLLDARIEKLEKNKTND